MKTRNLLRILFSERIVLHMRPDFNFEVAKRASLSDFRYPVHFRISQRKIEYLHNILCHDQFDSILFSFGTCKSHFIFGDQQSINSKKSNIHVEKEIQVFNLQIVSHVVGCGRFRNRYHSALHLPAQQHLHFNYRRKMVLLS